MNNFFKSILAACLVITIVGCSSSGTNSTAKWEIDLKLGLEDFKYSGKFKNDSSNLNTFWNSTEGSRANFVNNAISINFGGEENSENHIKGPSIYGQLGIDNPTTGKQMATFTIPLQPFPVQGEIEVNIRNLGTATTSAGGELEFGNEGIINIPSVTFLDSITGITRELSGSIKSVRIN